MIQAGRSLSLTYKPLQQGSLALDFFFGEHLDDPILFQCQMFSEINSRVASATNQGEDFVLPYDETFELAFKQIIDLPLGK